MISQTCKFWYFAGFIRFLLFFWYSLHLGGVHQNTSTVRVRVVQCGLFAGKGRGASSNADVRSFWCKTLDFSKFMVCPHEQGERGWASADKERGVDFRDLSGYFQGLDSRPNNRSGRSKNDMPTSLVSRDAADARRRYRLHSITRDSRDGDTPNRLEPLRTYCTNRWGWVHNSAPV